MLDLERQPADGQLSFSMRARLKCNTQGRGCSAGAAASSSGANDTVLVAKTTLGGESTAKAKNPKSSVRRRAQGCCILYEEFECASSAQRLGFFVQCSGEFGWVPRVYDGIIGFCGDCNDPPLGILLGVAVCVSVVAISHET